MNSSNLDARSILTAFDYSSLEDIDPSLGGLPLYPRERSSADLR